MDKIELANEILRQRQLDKAFAGPCDDLITIEVNISWLAEQLAQAVLNAREQVKQWLDDNGYVYHDDDPEKTLGDLIEQAKQEQREKDIKTIKEHLGDRLCLADDLIEAIKAST